MNTMLNTVEQTEETTDEVIKNTPALRGLVTAEFRRIEKSEEEIAERRGDIKAAIKRMTDRGLHSRAVKLALARRRLLAKGGLEEMDESLAIICSVYSLGIQGQLFEEAETE